MGGILSDRQIKSRCIKPSFRLAVAGGEYEWVIPGVTHSVDQIDAWVKRGYSRLVKVTEEDLAELNWKPMIEPYVPELVRHVTNVALSSQEIADDNREVFRDAIAVKKQRIISYGQSSYGYDIRIKREGIKLFSNVRGGVVDPMRNYAEQLQDAQIFIDEEFDLPYFILPPNTVALAHTVEAFSIPRNILVTCLSKSTYARVGLSQLCTPLEPEWEGELVLEIASMTNLPTRVYVGTGIAQLIFLIGDEPCEISYKDRDGKYQGQRGTTLARV